MAGGGGVELMSRHSPFYRLFPALSFSVSRFCCLCQPLPPASGSPPLACNRLSFNMVKLFGRKTTKEEQSPLMATGDGSVTSQRQQERAQRRAAREQRALAMKAARESPSKSSKKSNKRQLSQEDQDETDARLGCCTKFTQFIVKIVHLIDALIGITFIVYGSLIYLHFEEPAMEAVITSLSFGCIVLLSSLMGIFGFSFKTCKRCGLVFSSWAAIPIAFCYTFVIVALLGSPDTYFNYLTEHKDVLYLTDTEINAIKKCLPVFYIVLASLAATEICRFWILREIRNRLVRYDSANKRIASSSSNRSQLTESLIGDDYTYDEGEGAGHDV